MSDLPRILVCEDDPIYAKILSHQLKNHYDVTHVTSGERCVEVAGEGEFAVVLLDVMLPGMDGYTVCHELKENPLTSTLPVLFLSSNFGTADRMRGYEAGGFDYLVKPAAPEELLSKLSIILRMVDERDSLQENVTFAVSTAMTALSSQAELGVVLHFFKTSFACMSYQDLANAILAAVKEFSLDVSLQLRGRFGTVNISSQGRCSPLETSVLSTLSTIDRVVDLGARTAVSYDGISLILKNMPRENPELNGRLKDHLVMLAEGADARIRALDADLALDFKAKQMQGLVRSVGSSVAHIDKEIQQLHRRNREVFSGLLSELEGVLPILELSVSQEQFLERTIRTAVQEHQALASEEAAFDRTLYQVMEILQSAQSEQAIPQAT